MQDHKKQEKMTQPEVLSMLNKNLQDEVLIQIVGKILRNQRLFVKVFDERLQSEIIFMLKQKMFLMDDHIFEEGDKEDRFQPAVIEDQEEAAEALAGSVGPSVQQPGGQGIYFIIQGHIILFHKATHTYITDLGVEQIFGEISFFTG